MKDASETITSFRDIISVWETREISEVNDALANGQVLLNVYTVQSTAPVPDGYTHYVLGIRRND